MAPLEAHHESQRRYDAREQVHRRAAQAEHAHRPDRTHERRQAGDDRRSRASCHGRRQHDGQAEAERVEEQHVVPQRLGRLLAQGRQTGEFQLQHA
jgi:hypothetical protein